MTYPFPNFKGAEVMSSHTLLDMPLLIPRCVWPDSSFAVFGELKYQGQTGRDMTANIEFSYR